jgi:hypothetical protein
MNMRIINWDRLNFIAKKDSWFIADTKVRCMLSNGNPEPSVSDVVKSNSGLFKGMTDIKHSSFSNKPPKESIEICQFDEFDIYFEGKLVNDITYFDLIKLMKFKSIYNKL